MLTAPRHTDGLPDAPLPWRRRIDWMRLGAWFTIAASLLLIAWAIPVADVARLIRERVSGLGAWGPAAFGAVYVVATLLFVPGSALTLVAGAIFGLAGGTAIVSLASTTAAGLAFLVARSLARERVRRMAERSRTFAAIDEAIGRGGWRIVALLRLSPAVPFSIGNYLYGLTPVRFWPYLLASWIAMLPGTFLYVSLGHAGGAAAGIGGSAGRSPWQWALLVTGLLATAAVTVSVTRLARRALREAAPDVEPAPAPQGPRGAGDRRRVPLGLLVAAAVLAALAIWAQVGGA